MKIIVAPDKFKGSMTALEVAEAIERGLLKSLPSALITKVPMADGGEGTVRSLVDGTNGTIRQVEVTGPLGDRRTASFGILGDGKTAVIEMAAASGLALVPKEKRNPMVATTRGTGDLIKAALDDGCTRLIVGIGGSATNDAGVGMAQALGASFQDEDGNELEPGGRALSRLARINLSGLDPRIKRGVEVVTACDVTNPLTGPHGAAAIYGPQKGATPEMVQQLDLALGRLAQVITADLGVSVANLPGSGAAGGLGAGLIAFLGAQLRPGVDIVLEVTGLNDQLDGVDLVITGEGGMDSQTIYGKAPIGVAKAAKRRSLPVVAIVGTVGQGVEVVYDAGIDAVFSIISEPCALETAVIKGPEWVEHTAENVGRLIALSRNIN